MPPGSNEESPLFDKGPSSICGLGPSGLARLVTFSSSFSEGWDNAIFASIIVPVKKELALSGVVIGLLASLPICGEVLGTLFGGCVMDVIGRKPSLAITYAVSALGCFVMAMAPDVIVLIIGRCLLSFGIRAGTTVVTVFMTELSPAELRGRFVSLEEMFLNIGILAAFAASWFLLGSGILTWRVYTALGAVAPLLTLCCVLVLPVPESPRWLQQVGRQSEALSTLRSVLMGDEAEAQRTLQMWHEEAAGEERAVKSWVVEVPELLKQQGVRTAMVCWFARACSGIHVVGTYFIYFLSADMGYETALAWNVVGMVFKFAALIPTCLWLIESCGRRILFLISAVFCCACLGGATAVHLYHMQTMFFAIFIIGYFIAFSLGYGPVVWVYCAEILPNKRRGLTSALSLMPYHIFGFFLLTVAPVLYDVHLSLPFAMIAGTNAFAVILFWIFCRETKGLVLEEVHTAFSKP